MRQSESKPTSNSAGKIRQILSACLQRWFGRQAEAEQPATLLEQQIAEMRALAALATYYRRRGGLRAACAQIRYSQLEIERLRAELQTVYTECSGKGRRV